MVLVRSLLKNTQNRTFLKILIIFYTDRWLDINPYFISLYIKNYRFFSVSSDSEWIYTPFSAIKKNYVFLPQKPMFPLKLVLCFVFVFEFLFQSGPNFIDG